MYRKLSRRDADFCVSALFLVYRKVSRMGRYCSDPCAAVAPSDQLLLLCSLAGELKGRAPE